MAVALFATTFAAGCGKLAKCDDAKDKATCSDSKKFEDGKGNCTWTPDATDDKKGKCEAKTDEEICSAANKDEKTCKDASKGLKETKNECKFTAATGDAAATCVPGVK